MDNNINNENNKMDLIEKPVYNGKENVDEKNNLNKKFNSNEKHEDYQKNLSINLHKKNMRRIVNLEDTKQTQKSIIDFIDENNIEDADKEGTKRLLFPKNNNIYNENNNNENIIQNTNDKVPII